MTTTQATKTPGFDMHIEVWFSVDHSGRRVAHHFSRNAFRAVRIPLADAELFVATGQATEVSGHPFPATPARRPR
jgi:hypothetical protein